MRKFHKIITDELFTVAFPKIEKATFQWPFLVLYPVTD